MVKSPLKIPESLKFALMAMALMVVVADTAIAVEYKVDVVVGVELSVV